mmetsp:Transcript_26797/g.39650  ORF Transcript_26797/g.39650 Transcript_26797/m.39650 type:complete len:84 (+) Transcript_26797:303-554(+)
MCSRRFQNKQGRILGGDDVQLREVVDDAQLLETTVREDGFLVMGSGRNKLFRLGDVPALTVIASESIDLASSNRKFVIIVFFY